MRPKDMLLLRRSRLTLVIVAAVLLAGVGVTAAVRVGANEDRAAPALVSTSTSTTTTTLPPTTTPIPVTTTTALPTTTTLAAPPPTAAADTSGQAAVLAMQQRLTDLGYWLGTPDGGGGRLTAQAILAFQKAEGLARDSKAGPATLERLAVATRPVPASLDNGIEIDLARQLLFVIDQGAVKWVLNTSTGKSGWRTPTGDFAVYREIDGVRRAPLGNLYRPKYFTGGVAIHGSPSIPGYAASHGCTRVSNAAMDLLWSSGLLELGTPVRVH